jgi:large subunit ribosomal protein L35
LAAQDGTKEQTKRSSERVSGADMPKMKTVSGAKKRFKFTSRGKIRRSKAYRSHILTKKTRKQKRRLRRRTTVDKVNRKSIERLLPYR